MLLTYIFVDVDETVIVEPVQQWHINGVAFSFTLTHVLQIARAREEVTIPVEADGHHAVRHVEGLLDAIAMMNVDVDVEHALVILQQLENGKDDVVSVTKSFSLLLFRMV